MAQHHLKRITMPKTWPVKRKGITFITRPLPGTTTLNLGFSLATLMKDILGMCHTSKEVMAILHNQEVLVDGIRRREPRTLVGFMDVISFPAIKKQFRILLTQQGMLCAQETAKDAASIKILKKLRKLDRKWTKKPCQS